MYSIATYVLPYISFAITYYSMPSTPASEIQATGKATFEGPKKEGFENGLDALNILATQLENRDDDTASTRTTMAASIPTRDVGLTIAATQNTGFNLDMENEPEDPEIVAALGGVGEQPIEAYSPTTPQYSPTSPAYSPTSSAYNHSTTPPTELLDFADIPSGLPKIVSSLRYEGTSPCWSIKGRYNTPMPSFDSTYMEEKKEEEIDVPIVPFGPINSKRALTPPFRAWRKHSPVDPSKYVTCYSTKVPGHHGPYILIRPIIELEEEEEDVALKKPKLE
jgi:hypothetical protein